MMGSMSKALLLACLLSLSFFSPFSDARLISMTVGRSQNHVFTSREVHLRHLLGEAMKGKKAAYRLDSEDSKAFFAETDKTILEQLIAEESKHFSTVRLNESDFDRELKKLPTALFTSAEWKALKPAPEEWKEIFWRRLQAEKFIQFRAQSSVIPISDGEARRYFEENRLKFGDLPFEQFKENIKIFLRRSQVEQRLKDWYEVLRAKYKARNFL